MTPKNAQRTHSLEQISAATNEVERLMRDLRNELGFPKVVQAQEA